jgi:hypothetical protein
MYPGVHGRPTADLMGQCLARPVNRSDPLLRDWSKRLVIPSESKELNISRMHDDSAAFRGEDGRWWMLGLRRLGVKGDFESP